MSNALEWVLRYLELGWATIPLRFMGDADNRKRPAIESWKEFQVAAPDRGQVEAWWSGAPEFGVGVITGSVSRLLVVDLDGPRAAALLKARGIELPRTATVKTGNGYHMYFRHPGADIGNRAKIITDNDGSSVDVRGEGGYVVAPPSVHGNGRVYEWMIPVEEMAGLPPELEEFLLTAELGFPREGEANWWETVGGGVNEGSRNDSAARVAGYFLAKTSGDEEATFRACVSWNRQNTPPLADDELRTIIRSVGKREQAKQRAEVQRVVPRIEVLDGAAMAVELGTRTPRHGLQVNVPGLSIVGGLVEGDLITVAGRPGMGKSTWACQLSTLACLDKHIPTFIVSTEMSRSEWGNWMMTVASAGPCHELPWPRPEPLLALFRKAPLSLCDAGTVSIQDIKALVESRPGVKLVIVDHIGRVVGGRKDTRTLEVGDVIRGLKSIAKDNHCTVVALCQLNRDIENREVKRRPRLADLRESGEIEQESDSVIFLYSPKDIDKSAPFRDMKLVVEKYRHGPLGEIPVTFLLAERKFVLDKL